MADRDNSKSGRHQFGGDWTEQKLQIIEKYLSAYTTALKRTPFQKGYIDAFAGTPYRTIRSATGAPEAKALLFPELAAEGPQQLLEGSARRALKIDPPFDEYTFIEKSKDRCISLQTLKQDFPHLANQIQIIRGEANEAIKSLCQKSWGSRRAVLFLDPYGMQVEWTTIEAIASTKAIDLWLLFPLGVAVNRMLTKSGRIDPTWAATLDRLFGTKEWRTELYDTDSRGQGLLFEGDEQLNKVGMDQIGQYFVKRLKTVFPAVADSPAVLRNSAQCPLYLLCFAAANEKGGRIALKIANHILKPGV